jgi:hypothetical protein
MVEEQSSRSVRPCLLLFFFFSSMVLASAPLPLLSPVRDCSDECCGVVWCSSVRSLDGTQYVLLRSANLCYDMLCYAMLCCTVFT